MYVADFETTTDPNDCRVWAWGLASVITPEIVEMGIDLDSFIDRISSESSACYFHNLGFDGKFIIPYLLINGFQHVTGQTAIPHKGFKTLISNMNKFYSITVRWENGNTTEFRDSLKKLPMSVSRIAKSFNLEESKGELDYAAYRPVGHQLTDDEAEYLRKDVTIVAKAMQEVLSNGMTKLTVASDSLAEYKKLTGDKMFSRLFPVLANAMDAEIRRAYKGGFTYADPRFTGSVTRSGLVLDVNSLYPYVMRSKMLPYGEPYFVNDKVTPTASHPLTIFSVTFTAKLKPDHIPCIQIKGQSIFAPTEYLRVIDEPTTLMVTNVDWDLYNAHYDIEVLEYGGGWRFHASEGMFDTYIDKWAKVKAESTGGKKEIAKLHLNSLYGKFASNPDVTSKIPVLENGVLRLRIGPHETRPPVYTAVGAFITAYARQLTISSAQSNYSVFAYADTDSLHLLTDTIPDTIDIHPSRIGAWKHEYNFQAAWYVRPKVYFEQMHDGAYVNHVAGLPPHVAADIRFSDIQDNRTFDGKLNPRSVPGGVVLEPIPWKLKL